MKNLLLAAVAAIAFTAPASAAVLTVGSGWQSDILSAAGQPTDNSAWTFTISSGAHLSVTDDFVVGDIYVLSGSVNGTSTFFAGPNDVRATGSFGSAWLNPSYSKFTTFLGAGTYKFSITGQGEGGIPAGLGVRLDAGVPEPAAWAMMLAGFGLVGVGLRRRTTVSFA
jgi:hypothetical protein